MSFVVGLKQIGSGFRTMFGCGSKKVAQSYAQKASRYTGPTLSEMVAKQPLALPAPSAAQLAKNVPMVNVGKATKGWNLDELRMSQEILKDGTHVRYFRAPGNNKVLIKMEDKGILHKEWVYGNNPEQLTYVKSTGGGDIYVLKKDGAYTQIEKQAIKYKDGINQKVSTNDLYYTNGLGEGFHANKTKGLNGANTSNLEIYGTYSDYGKTIPYRVSTNFGIMAEHKSVNELLDKVYCASGGDTACDVSKRVYNKVHFVEENLVDDLADSLFSAYKA